MRINKAEHEIVVEHIRANSQNRAFSLDAIEQVADQQTWKPYGGGIR